MSCRSKPSQMYTQPVVCAGLPVILRAIDARMITTIKTTAA
ncbi:hypothetical protein MIZ03_4784 [Rhodoferax lithotrophicus]|uniref:Uncharacterized protein n=1 Tax=Rhodoferax lithotrophicus TaxID=2798804 RepID=A0ABN6DD23_9BURK|nr:hypothetical protein MIZ03_4784 [Rhodoferax sp. MIZ03]